MHQTIPHQKIQRRHDINNLYKQNYTYFNQRKTPMNSECSRQLSICSNSPSCSLDFQIAADTVKACFHLRKSTVAVKGAASRLSGLKSLAKFFNFVVCNPYQSSPSLIFFVPLWLIIVSLVFFYLCKALFSNFLQFRCNFVNGQNNSV